MNNGNGKPLVAEYELVPDLRDREQVQLLDAGWIVALLCREVLPYAAYAWIDTAGFKMGCEISFTRYFCKPKPLRTREETKGMMNIIIKGGAS
jgi:type I restriction enzyme M protein